MDEEYEDEGSELEQQIAQQEQELMQLQQMQAEQEKQQKAEERLLKNKLKFIKSNVAVSSRTFLKESEKKTIKKAKKHKSLKNDIKQIEAMLSINKAKNTSKVITSLPALNWLIVIALIILIMIVVVATFSTIFGNGDDGKAVYGITGDDFYGVRMVYMDETKASQTIIQDYTEFVESGINQAKTIETVSVDGTNYNIELNIDIDIPEDEYFLTLNQENEIEFSTNCAGLYNIIYNDIAKPIYKIDYGTDFSGTLIDCVNGIKYFGFTNMAEIAPMVAENLILPSSFAATNAGEAVSDATILGKIEDVIETKIVEYYTTETKYSIRTEKWFVKDYILTEDDEMISGVKKENYVALIFMPKKDVTFTKISFAVGNANLNGFKITLNGEDLPTDGSNLGNQEIQSYIYGGEVNITGTKFVDIDENNLTALENVSLFDIVESVDNFNLYLQEITTTGENPITYFTIKQNGVVVRTENTEPFSLVEYETAWE